MTTGTVLMGLLGAGIGLGVALLVAWWRRAPLPTPRWPRQCHSAVHVTRRRAWWWAASGAGGVVVAVGTGWLVAGALAAVAALGLPRLLGSTRGQARAVARVEAIASWSEMLRDTLSAAAGLEQAVIATADIAPESIRPQITELAARLERGERLAPSLRQLADQLADPTADLVISALVLASERQARQLADLLGELAAETREQVSMRLRVDASRARVRASVRLIVAVTLSFAGGLIVLNRDYLAPFDDPVGQGVLAVVGGLFTVAFWWLSRMSHHQTPARFLTNLDALPASTSPAASGGVS